MNTKVLVVDDEFLIRMSLESGLSDLGHQVKTAETFSEGLALAESWRPDVVLLDKVTSALNPSTARAVEEMVLELDVS